MSMENKDKANFIIEVKTKWEKENGKFTRKGYINKEKTNKKILIIELFSNKKCCTKSINNDTNYPNS